MNTVVHAMNAVVDAALDAFIDAITVIAGRRTYIRSLPQPCGRTTALR
ncbi:hypothetical protein ACWD26_09135 [Streptomyces sp. NPDC002787]